MLTTRTMVVKCSCLLVWATSLYAAEPNPVGRPRVFEQGRGVMLAVWYEDGYWVIRTTTDTKEGNKQFNARHDFLGSVRVPRGRITNLDVTTLEARGKPAEVDRVVRKSSGLDFKFVNFGGIDGIRFKVSEGTKEVEFDIKIDGDDNRNKIFVGSQSQHPSSAKFRLTLPTQK